MTADRLAAFLLLSRFLLRLSSLRFSGISGLTRLLFCLALSPGSYESAGRGSLLDILGRNDNIEAEGDGA